MSCTSRVISRASSGLASTSRLAVLSPISFRLPAAAAVAGPSRIPYRPRFAIRHATSVASSSSTAANPGLPPIPPQPSIRVEPPSLDAIKEEGFAEDNVELVPPDEARLVITQSAVQQLVLITSREPPENLAKNKLALRVGVESGGCHGYQYSMAITEERGVDDYIMQPEGVNSIPVVIDLMSLGLMKGSTLDYATELIGSAFRIEKNPQAKDGGACGCGISWEAK